MMFRWRASLWKTVWRELLIYLLLYLAISLIYRFYSTISSGSSQNLRFLLMAPIIDDEGHRGKATEEQIYFEKVQQI